MRRVLLLVMAAFIGGCPRPVPDGTVETPELSTVTMPGSQAAFDAAVGLYESGRFAEAVDAFRMFCAEFPVDPLAPHGEIYLGRSLAALGATVDAERTFVALAASGEESSVVDAAQLYTAFVASLRGDHGRAASMLVDAFGDRADLIPDRAAIIPGDEGLLWSLLAEARLSDGDLIGAISDLSIVADRAVASDLRRYAVERAEALASAGLALEELESVSTSSSFGCAVTARALVGELAAGGDTQAASDVGSRCADAMMDFGLSDDIPVVTAMAGTAGEQTARIGVLLSLSGPNRRAGRAALGSILLAARAFDDATPSVAFVIRDAQGSGEVAQTEVEAMAALGVAAIIGPVENDVADSARRTAAAAGIPMISLGSLPPTEPVRGTFRLQVDPTIEATALVEALVAERDVRSAVIAVESGRDTTWLELFADAAESALALEGGSVTAVVSVDVTDLQASSEAAATAIAQSGADCVIFALSDEPASTLTAWLATQNVWSRGATSAANDGRIRMAYGLSSFAWGDTLVRNSLTYVESALFATWFDPATAVGPGREFADRFEWTYGRPPGTLEAFAFDAATLVRSRIVGGANSASAMGAVLAGADGVSGATGTISFTSVGEPAGEPSITTVDQGQLRVLREP